MTRPEIEVELARLSRLEEAARAVLNSSKADVTTPFTNDCKTVTTDSLLELARVLSQPAADGEGDS